MIVFTQQTSHIPTWAVYLILVLGFFGLIISLYGASTAFKYNKKLKNKNNYKKVLNLLSTRQAYSWTQIDNIDQQGYFLIGITLKDSDDNKNKPLITLLKITDLKTDISKFKSNINDYKNIINYLKQYNLTTKDLVFIIIEKVENSDELDKLLIEWNSLISA
ncbi:hypothetical protein [Mycoplasma mycoides]|uniref:hypothetical protein n=1 Tax=Mycoplasma mycoides TaxID=2102 RepID=UPI00273240B1|nr:hypothetical protein [Mycoplasma mycoides]MDP4040529.1 hypothetical protein [Mycoplasma mycoides]MDP4041344.1 hypothetical protein [Mycoplasma mycoides]MDP4042336.1 hypothetical protein [Mycoplasma mycoides]MDP4043738.1 hypothetical protein [Mycoplasma mycoides]MDP4044605.1 hypothetical protein [Mycoplasma mycoides]